jgi:prepilin-type processing-associated H-X9-DG protein
MLKTKPGLLLAGVLCFVPASRVLAQTTTATDGAQAATSALTNLLNGAEAPLTLPLKSLNGEWRRVSISGQGDMNPFTMTFMPNDQVVYYTRGQVVVVGGESFVAAYRAPIKKVDFMSLMRMGPGTQLPLPDKLTPDTTLSLTLLNLRIVNMIGDITRFDLKEELARSERQIAAAQVNAQALTAGAQVNAGNLNQVSSSNLKQVSLAMMQYLQDHDDTFPKMETAEEVMKVLLPYAKNEAIFVHPQSREPYQPNAALSGKKAISIADPAAMVIFYEMSPADDGTRGIAYADGHVKRASEAEWPQIKKASRVP